MSSPKNPLVSIVIPSYNHEKYIESTIQSILNQTYQNIEIIIVDDYSKDRSREIILNYEKQKNVKIIFNKENKGVAASLNEGFNNANGDFFATCASDDLWDPKKIELQLNEFTNGNIVLCHTAAKYINSEGKKTGNVRWSKGYSKNNFEHLLLNGSFVVAGSAIFKRDIFFITSGFDASLKIEDFDFFLKASQHGEFSYIDKPLFFYRRHEKNTSSNSTMMIENQLKILKKYNHIKNVLGHNLKNEWDLNFFYMYAKTEKKFAISKYINLKFITKNIYRKKFILAVLKLAL